MTSSHCVTRWRDEAVQPDEYSDVAGLVRLARKARGRIVEFEWALTRDELRELREAVYVWGSNVVGRYRCFDARVLAAMNQALGETDSLLVLREPKNARGMDCSATCSRESDGYRLRGHGPFDVVFAYGHAALAREPGAHASLTERLVATLAQTVEQLGWRLPVLLEPRLLPVRNVLYGLPVGRGAKDEPVAEHTVRETGVRFEGPFGVTPGVGMACLFDEVCRNLADASGIYLWTLLVNGQHRPWYVGQTRQGFGVRIAQHIQALLAGQYEILDLSKLNDGSRSVVWHPSARNARWPANLPEFLDRHASLMPAAVDMLRGTRFFLAVLGDDPHLLNCVEGAIGRHFQRHADARARRYFGTGIKLPPRIPNDQPIRLSISSAEPIEGMPLELREP